MGDDSANISRPSSLLLLMCLMASNDCFGSAYRQEKIRRSVNREGAVMKRDIPTCDEPHRDYDGADAYG